MQDWAKGSLSLLPSPNNTLNDKFFPLLAKPLPFVLYTKEDAERGGNDHIEKNALSLPNIDRNYTSRFPIIFIQNGKDFGFAGSNNIGIKYALAKNDFSYIWLLNNDTVIENDSLNKLVEKAEQYKKEGEKVGIIGSKLYYYHNPNLLQGVGGKYNKWLGTSQHIGGFGEDNGQFDNDNFKIDYVIGASMFVCKEFIQDVGLMCEDYYLYFEELDWAVRGKIKNWKLKFCWESIVFHKEGAAVGSSSDGMQKSEFSDYYGLKNRIRFTKKFYPYCLPTVYLGFLGVIWNRIRRGRYKFIAKFLLNLYRDEYK